ncbi:MAG: discoidin domain-containing protein [Lentisphaerae bacterium]|jgi:heparin/heparan-sulfate lyase|nr:discoidin domain-containing protein [Lentisphaerota bacterium]
MKIAMLFFALSSVAMLSAQPVIIPVDKLVLLEAERATLSSDRAVVTAIPVGKNRQGVTLAPGVEEKNSLDQESPPDLTFVIQAERPGRFLLSSRADVDEHGLKLMRKARSKHQSLFLKLQIDDQRPTRRVAYLPLTESKLYRRVLGKFMLNGEIQQLKVWLPRGLRLDRMEVTTYRPPPVPEAVTDYQPTVLPPKVHPRLWVTPDTLPQIKANLTHPEHAAAWERVSKQAIEPFVFTFAPDRELTYNTKLEDAAANKACYYLMTGERKVGREAVQLMLDYLPRVEYGNQLDITREIGAAIYAAARVYDWCYDIISDPERQLLHQHLMRLADDMECGWPPFKQTIVNGHGNEMQINRDLLSMAIAVYDEDPLPYQYCAWRVLEELVPMRRFEYESPRHNQGITYGSYRFGCEMHAAWLFKRMTGQEVFHPNIKNVPLYWLYMRLPDGDMLRDGDCVAFSGYWKAQLTFLLCYAYSGSRLLKGEFLRQGGLYRDPVLFLLVNDPTIEPDDDLWQLPLTIDFGPILGGMVARTGWNFGLMAGDVVAEIKGGGYHFGNHQLADAGAFQINCRGMLAAPLSQYLFYGTGFDMNFNKRSVAQSMMLAVDPEEKFLWFEANDGGTRFVRGAPLTPEQARTDPNFNNGRVVACSFGPSTQLPLFSYYAVNLVGAYSATISDYQRQFCFLNISTPGHPATIIVLDDMTTSNPAFQKYWQSNTLHPPTVTADGVRLHSQASASALDVNMVLPTPAERTVEVLSGDKAFNVFGRQYTPPYPKLPESHGHRVMFSPRQARENDVFLTVLQVLDGAVEPFPCVTGATDVSYTVSLAGRLVSLAKGTGLIDRPFSLSVEKAGTQVLCAGLAPGLWEVRPTAGRAFACQVQARANTLFFLAPEAGEYRFAPGSGEGMPRLELAEPLPTASAPRLMPGMIELEGKVLDDVKAVKKDREFLAPLQQFLRQREVAAVEKDGRFAFTLGGHDIVLSEKSPDLVIDGTCLAGVLSPPSRDDGWLFPAAALAFLEDRSCHRDPLSNVLFFSAPEKREHGMLWLFSRDSDNPNRLFSILDDDPAKTSYWAARGRSVAFVAMLAEETQVQGVAIRWHLGDKRASSFAIECSRDGVQWENVFSGQSSGKTTAFEEYRFAAPVTCRQLRFIGKGNSANDWNSVVAFKVLH